MKKIIGFLILAIEIVLLNLTTFASDKDLFIDGDVQQLFSAENGLLSSSATSIAQTNEGFIWIGGYGGLMRYDGHAFEEFGQGMLSNIKDLLAGQDGELWIASADQGLVRYDDDIYTEFTSEDGKTLEAQSLCISENGIVSVGTSNGIGVVSGEGMVKMLDIPTLTETFINRIYALSDTRLLCVSRAGDLYLCEGETCTRVDLGMQSHNVRSVTYDKVDDVFYVGTSGTILIRCAGDLSVEELLHVPTLECINTVMMDEDHCLWLCADNGVAMYYNGEFRLQRLIMDNSIDHMMVDAEGSFWFTSSRQGVLEVSESRFSDVSQSARLDSLVVNAIEKIGDQLYIGHDEGLTIIDVNTYETIEDEVFDRLDGVRIRCVCADNKGNLWFGTKSKGLLCYDHEGKWRTYSSVTFPTILSDSFRCIFQKEDSILVGTDSGAYEIGENRVRSVIHPSLHFGHRVLSIASMGGRTYIGTDGYGVYVVENGEIVSHLTTDNELRSNVVMKLCYSEEHDCMWMVTGNNLARIDADGTVHNVENFPATNNLDMIIISDEEVWIPSGGGIYQTTEEDLMDDMPEQPKLYRHIDGLPYEVTANSNQRLDGNILYLCGSGGVTSLRTGADSDEDRVYHLVIDNVRVDNVRHAVQEDTCEIAATARRLEIGAHVLTFRTDDPQIFYYLEGFDDEMTVCRFTDHPTISYTNLDGGDYVFHYGVLDEETRQPAQEVTLAISKHYRPLERNSEKALVVVAAVLLAAVITALIVRARMKREKLQISAEFEKKEKEHFEEMAMRDYLTGLYNRNYLEVWNESVYPDASYPITFVTVDCNNLKRINDTFGHKKGDLLITSTARFLADEFSGEGEVVMRHGGDEFLVLTAGIDEETVHARMEKVREEASGLMIESVPLTFCYGICTMDKENYDFEEGLRTSDMRMLEEKGRFHNRRRTDRMPGFDRRAGSHEDRRTGNTEGRRSGDKENTAGGNADTEEKQDAKDGRPEG